MTDLQDLIRFGKAYRSLGDAVASQLDRLLEGGPFEPGELNPNAMSLIEKRILPLVDDEFDRENLEDLLQEVR